MAFIIRAFIFVAAVTCMGISARADDEKQTGYIKSDVVTTPKFGANTDRSPKFGAATDRNSIAFTRNDFPDGGESHEGPHEHIIVVRNRGFSGVDKNRSGDIDREEFNEYHADDRDFDSAAKFDELDTNQDSRLSKAEFKAKR